MKLTEKSKFIIKRGVLGQGLLTALIYIIINVLIDGLGNPRNFILKCIVSIIIFPALGYVWGLMIWKSRIKDDSNKKDIYLSTVLFSMNFTVSLLRIQK